jgi:hypothetical protein
MKTRPELLRSLQIANAIEVKRLWANLPQDPVTHDLRSAQPCRLPQWPPFRPASSPRLDLREHILEFCIKALFAELYEVEDDLKRLEGQGWAGLVTIGTDPYDSDHHFAQATVDLGDEWTITATMGFGENTGSLYAYCWAAFEGKQKEIREWYINIDERPGQHLGVGFRWAIEELTEWVNRQREASPEQPTPEQPGQTLEEESDRKAN